MEIDSNQIPSIRLRTKYYLELNLRSICLSVDAFFLTTFITPKNNYVKTEKKSGGT